MILVWVRQPLAALSMQAMGEVNPFSEGGRRHGAPYFSFKRSSAFEI
jgi:hypothetical protein